MKKFTCLVVAALVLVIAPVAMANITLTDAYFAADAEVWSYLLGSDSDHADGFSPVTASAALGNQESSVGSVATSNWFNLNSWSYVGFQPGDVGYAGSSSVSLMLGLTSDTTWLLDTETVFSIDSSLNGSANITAALLVSDLSNNLIYSYDVTADGLSDSVTIGAGSYNLEFSVTSFAIVPEFSDLPEYAYSSVDLSVNIIPIPAPSAVLLSSIGISMVGCGFRKRKIQHS